MQNASSVSVSLVWLLKGLEPFCLCFVGKYIGTSWLKNFFILYSTLSFVYYINVIELACSVRTGKILVLSFFASLWTEPQHIWSVKRARCKTKKLFLFRHFCRTYAKIFGQTRKRFLLNAKMFPFEYLFKNTKQWNHFMSSPS